MQSSTPFSPITPRSKRSERGQFVPISAMVMFTCVMFMIAIVNVYKVSRAKLKVQNLADAAALNLASQQAQAFNIVMDRNEWLNHMLEGIPSPSDPKAGGAFANCNAFGVDMRPLIPGISCVENSIPVEQDDGTAVMRKHVFRARGDAIMYGMIIHTVNQAQQLFVRAYNSFLGDQSAGAASASATGNPVHFEGLLKKDIPDLDKPGIRLIAWNSRAKEPGSIEAGVESAKQSNKSISPRMDPLEIEVARDIKTRYQTNQTIEATTFGKLLYGKVDYGNDAGKLGPLCCGTPQAVGWMIPKQNTPRISVGKGGDKIGVGVIVSQDIDLPLIKTLTVAARSKAYVVEESGETPKKTDKIPKFRPTYWVKLAN